MATYSYDSWGNLTSSNETFTNGWSNPYRYDGRDGARYDASTGLYWLSVRAYDPSVGRFLSRDPLGRAPLFLSANPYVYAGNNPLSNVDPSGQKVMGASSSQTKQTAKKQANKSRVQMKRGASVKQVVHLHAVKVAKMSLHLTAAPSLLDPQAGWDFAKAVAALAAGIFAMALAGATFATIGAEGADPVGDLIAIVMFMNGIDAFIHAAEFAATAIWGQGSGIAMMLKSFAVIADLVITLADAATIALVLTPATIGGVVTALATNVVALTAIYTFTSVDLGADIMDLQDLLGK